jgi:hypothetical protein
MNGFRGMPCSYSSWTTELNGLPEGSRPTRRLGKVRLSKRPALSSKVLNDDVGRNVVLGVRGGMIRNSH